MKSKQIITIIAIILVIALIGFLCYGYYGKFIKKVENPIATIEIEGYGEVKVELYPDVAPNTVANFIILANHGFYNGLTFHRTIPDFMIQGGDKTGTGTGTPSIKDIMNDAVLIGFKEFIDIALPNNDIMDSIKEDKTYAIKGEFIANGYLKNTLRHEEGVISMARSDYSMYGYTEEGYNSAGSQFFIMTKNTPSLNGLYSAFGKVVEGMDIIHQIENVEVVTRESNAGNADKPVNPPVIKSITVDTHGVDYGIPETIDNFDIQSLFSQYN